jgi:hypothetical protein
MPENELSIFEFKISKISKTKCRIVMEKASDYKE